MRRLIATLLLCALSSCGSLTPVLAQHNHAAGHNDYQGWASEVTANCCNNQDCGSLHDEDVRESVAGTEIRIEGQWCPVLPKHYIKRGRSPDWNKSHACIRPKYVDDDGTPMDEPPCGRLLCFGGKGGV